MVVGPRFRETFLPGYPTKEDSPFHEADFEGRHIVELPFSDDIRIGQFQAHDYFGDGSFYILSVPGHAVGHISGLVRTTPDSFVFLGGDVCHFTGVIRPTPFLPLPDEIPEEAALGKRIPRPCPCSAFLASHPEPTNSRTVLKMCLSNDRCLSLIVVFTVLLLLVFNVANSLNLVLIELS